jgi:hypothetical protein
VWALFLGCGFCGWVWLRSLAWEWKVIAFKEESTSGGIQSRPLSAHHCMNLKILSCSSLHRELQRAGAPEGRSSRGQELHKMFSKATGPDWEPQRRREPSSTKL